MTPEASPDRAACGDTAGLIAQLAALPEAEQRRVIAALPRGQAEEFAERWSAWAHAGQLAPAGDWRVWLIRAGRGFGKTRAGAEWVSQMVRDVPGARVALVGASVDDVRQVMIEGPSGLLSVARTGEAPAYNVTAGEVRWPGGAVARVYSAAAPERLRGPEHHAAWCDELAKWRNGDATWDNLMMTMRLGAAPQVVVTTTPRPTRLMRRVMALADKVETHGASGDNPHLPARFVAAMAADYGDGRLGRQEIGGEMIDDTDGALWTRALIDRRRVPEAAPAARTLVGVDPPAGVGRDACGIVAVRKGIDGRAYVIEDASVAGASPEGWARAVAACAARVGADRVVAEGNQGGAMVRTVLHGADATLPVTIVHARVGKVARAEPVAALYEAGRAWHAGVFPALEDEMCGLMAGGGYEGPGRSPDRADALVWAMTAAMLRGKAAPGVRGV